MLDFRNHKTAVSFVATALYVGMALGMPRAMGALVDSLTKFGKTSISGSVTLANEQIGYVHLNCDPSAKYIALAQRQGRKQICSFSSRKNPLGWIVFKDDPSCSMNVTETFQYLINDVCRPNGTINFDRVQVSLVRAHYPSGAVLDIK